MRTGQWLQLVEATGAASRKALANLDRAHAARSGVNQDTMHVLYQMLRANVEGLPRVNILGNNNMVALGRLVNGGLVEVEGRKKPDLSEEVWFSLAPAIPR